MCMWIWLCLQNLARGETGNASVRYSRLCSLRLGPGRMQAYLLESRRRRWKMRFGRGDVERGCAGACSGRSRGPRGKSPAREGFGLRGSFVLGWRDGEGWRGCCLWRGLGLGRV
ncbi:hypothetical protein B0J11DRAFT_521553 [Dendryphion nanum]|uniref:Secreted protein n=1 Tax=Dendryphion nanum TaxID=256645 RepID=A0A9P9E7S7_9PLEO|nr:hypothetical protein B0J11DRAFT_521553 [Dendryphion nanum]